MSPAVLAVALSYGAPSGCPVEAHFWQSLTEAAPQLRRGEPGPQGPRYRVRVESTATAFRGELSEVGQPLPRTLEAVDCRELVEALALMLALAVQSQEPPPERATLSPEPSRLLGASPPGPSAIAVAKVIPPTAAPPVVDHAEKPARVMSRSNWSASGAGLAWLGAAPDLLWGGSVAVDRRFVFQRLTARFELRAARADTRASTLYAGVAPQICATLIDHRLLLSSCGGITLGWLSVEGVEYSAAESTLPSSAWFAVLLGAHAALPLNSAWFLDLGVEAEYALHRRDYHVKRDDSEFSTPMLSALMTFGVGARF